MRNLLILALFISAIGHTAVDIRVEADSGRKAISPYIYGKNDGIKNNTTDTVLTVFRDAGLRMIRANGGNNASKYNWSRHLASHPDWYNNVYGTNWDEIAQNIQERTPEIDGMFAFQLTGWAASNTDNNFNDWGYNQSTFWEGVTQNLAGGGVPNTAGGSVAATPGDPNNYLMPWPADSTAGILPHWFGPDGLGLDSNRFRYWNMDNEVGIWQGTHDDVFPTQPSAEEFIQKYKAVALAVRAHYPGVKLVAPASATEWQWWTWAPSNLVSYKGRSVSWPEFLIWRLSEIQDSTGVRMLDVYDAHFYVSNVQPIDLVQEHRVLFDTTYEFPNANGVRFAEGGWNGSEKKEYLFERINRWLVQYFGPDHGIGLGASESAIMTTAPNASLSTVWYASFLGTFADHGVELFTPWSWDVGQWEVLHLFSKKGHDTRVLSRSSLDSLVSAYSSISESGDSLTVIVVNRDLSNSQDVNISLNGFVASDSGIKWQLSGLPSHETFISESQNATVVSVVNVSNSSLSFTLPSLSVTAIQLRKQSEPALSSSSVAPSSSSMVLSSSDMASSSSDSPTSIKNLVELRLLVRNTSHGILIEGTDGSETIQIFDTKGNLQKSIPASSGYTAINYKQSGAFIRIQKGSQVQWTFVPRL